MNNYEYRASPYRLLSFPYSDYRSNHNYSLLITHYSLLITLLAS